MVENCATVPSVLLSWRQFELRGNFQPIGHCQSVDIVKTRRVCS